MPTRGKNREQIIRQIENIEQQLRTLRLELVEQDNNEPGPSQQGSEIRLGDIVVIKNPRPGQPNEGKVSKINQGTGRITVTATTARGRETKIVRLRKNLSKRQEA